MKTMRINTCVELSDEVAALVKVVYDITTCEQLSADIGQQVLVIDQMPRKKISGVFGYSVFVYLEVYDYGFYILERYLDEEEIFWAKLEAGEYAGEVSYND